MRCFQSLFRGKRIFLYLDRDDIDLDCQLAVLDLTAKDFLRAKQLWMQFANDYGIPPGKLRVNDSVADIVKTDFFGDRGLYFEKLLTERGIKCFSSETATLESLIRQLL